MITYYGEAVVTATLSKLDTISFNYRQWQWVSSIGEVPYFDSTYDLNYRHKFNNKLSGNLEARLLGSDYTSGLAYTAAGHTPTTASTKKRNDVMYTFAAGLQYAITAHISTQLAYSFDFGRNAQDGVSDAGRVFNRQILSIGATFGF